MGVEWPDCTKVAKLIGVKTFLNEFLAFGQLSVFINNRKNTSPGPVLSVRDDFIQQYDSGGQLGINVVEHADHYYTLVRGGRQTNKC